MKAAARLSGPINGAGLGDGVCHEFKMRFKGVWRAARAVKVPHGLIWRSKRKEERAALAWRKIEAGKITDPRTIAALNKEFAREFATFKTNPPQA